MLRGFSVRNDHCSLDTDHCFKVDETIQGKSIALYLFSVSDKSRAGMHYQILFYYSPGQDFIDTAGSVSQRSLKHLSRWPLACEHMK